MFNLFSPICLPPNPTRSPPFEDARKPASHRKRQCTPAYSRLGRHFRESLINPEPAFADSFAMVRTTLSLCPSGLTVGLRVPAENGSTGCTLNLINRKINRKRSISSKVDHLFNVPTSAPHYSTARKHPCVHG